MKWPRDVLRDSEDGAGAAAPAVAVEEPPPRRFDAADDEPPPAAKPKDEKLDAKPAADPQLEELSKQVTELKKSQQRASEQSQARIRELETTAEYWQKVSTGEIEPQHKSREAAPAADEEAGDVDIVEALASNDKPAIRRYLKAAGFVPAEELPKLEQAFAERLETRIRGEREAITEETEVYTLFPELKDENSELFAKTRHRYLGYAKTEFGKSAKALKLAALEAAAELGISPGGNGKDKDSGGETAEERPHRRAEPEAAPARPRRPTTTSSARPRNTSASSWA
jgi:hypothetical protein